VRVLAASAVDFLLECLGLGSSRPGSGEGLLLQDGPSSSQHHLRSDSARRLVETDAAHSLKLRHSTDVSIFFVAYKHATDQLVEVLGDGCREAQV